MAKAKTASKNNPSTREKARVYKHNNEEVKVVMVIWNKRRYMSACYVSNGKLVTDRFGAPVTWKQISNSN